MTEDASRAEWLQQARSYLRGADPVLARLIDERPDFDPRAWLAQLPPMDLYGALLFQVAGQQLSVAATRRTLARIEALFGGHLPSPGYGATSRPPLQLPQKHSQLSPCQMSTFVGLCAAFPPEKQTFYGLRNYQNWWETTSCRRR